MLKVKSPWPSNTETKPRKQQMDAASRKFHLFVTRVSKSRFGTNLKIPNFANLINEPWNGMYFESQTNWTPSVHVSKQWIFKPPKKCNTNTDRDLWLNLITETGKNWVKFKGLSIQNPNLELKVFSLTLNFVPPKLSEPQTFWSWFVPSLDCQLYSPAIIIIYLKNISKIRWLIIVSLNYLRIFKKIFWWNYINIYLKLVFELKTHITMNFQEWKKDIFKRIYIESVLTTKTFRIIFLFNEFVVLFLIFEKPLLQHQSNIPPQIFSRK